MIYIFLRILRLSFIKYSNNLIRLIHKTLIYFNYTIKLKEERFLTDNYENI